MLTWFTRQSASIQSAFVTHRHRPTQSTAGNTHKSMVDPDLQIRGGPGHPDPEKRSGGSLQKVFFGASGLNLVLNRVSQKFVPLISCTITFDKNFIFT